MQEEGKRVWNDKWELKLGYIPLVETEVISAAVDCFFFLLCFLGLHPRHVEVPRLGVKLEL